MLKSALNLLTNSTKRELKLRTELNRAMLRREAEIGGRLFGELKDDQSREFFCFDSHSWVWHEEWNDETGARHIQTTRYDVRADGVYKTQEGIGYKKLNENEAKNLLNAVKLYKKYIVEPLYGFTNQLT
jgi:hypothetical protein